MLLLLLQLLGLRLLRHDEVLLLVAMVVLIVCWGTRPILTTLCVMLILLIG
jgi:hypothetical protein